LEGGGKPPHSEGYSNVSRHARCFAISRIDRFSNRACSGLLSHVDRPDGCGRTTTSNVRFARRTRWASPTTSDRTADPINCCAA